MKSRIRLLLVWTSIDKSLQTVKTIYHIFDTTDFMVQKYYSAFVFLVLELKCDETLSSCLLYTYTI